MRPPLSPLPSLLSLLSRSPPRPSPGSLHYSDEDVTKYNDLIQAESSSLTEKPSEVSDSQVRGAGRGRSRPFGELACMAALRAQLLPFMGRSDSGAPANDVEVGYRPAAPSQALLRVCSRGSWGPWNRDSVRHPETVVLTLSGGTTYSVTQWLGPVKAREGEEREVDTAACLARARRTDTLS